MSYQVRAAAHADREQFLHLWLLYLQEGGKLGSPIRANQHNMTMYRSLFDAYTVGSMFGVVTCAEVDATLVGCFMAGELPSQGNFHLETDRGRLAEVWGVWVVPEWRRQGIAHQMQDRALEIGRQLGFDGVVSSVRFNQPAQNNALHWGTVGEALRIYRDLRTR